MSEAPKSSMYPGKRWSPAGVVLVLTALCGVMTTFGATVLGPWLSKPDLTGYVKEDRLLACETKLDARAESHEKALDGERSRTTECYDKLGACRSQTGGMEQVISSLETPKRRR